MKSTNILAISVLLLMTLLISSCENEKLEPIPTEQSTFSSQFVKRSQNAVDKINEFYRQNTDSELEARSGESFEELWGQPDFDQIIGLRTLADNDLAIAPLKDLNTGTTHNLMVGWQQSDSIALRLVHDNRTLTDLTFDNTAITRSVPNLFDLFNSGEDLSATSTQFPDEGCFTAGDYCDGCLISFLEVDCGGIGGTGNDTDDGGSDPWSDPYDPFEDSADNPFDPGTDDTDTSNTDNTGGETTNPDCTTDDPANGPPSDTPFDNPDCVNTCAGTFDTDCDGTLDLTESCMEQGGNMWDCCTLTNSCTSFDTNLQTLQNNGISQSDLQWLFDNPSYLSSVMTFAQEKNFDAESMAAIEVLTQLGQNNLLFSNYSESDEILANQIIFNAEDCCGTLTVPVAHLQHTGRLAEEYTYLKQKWLVENPGQSITTLKQIGLYLEAEWNILKGSIHTVFDMCGLVPLLGEACDLTNGFIYTIEGDGLNAALAFGSAIPIYGWASTGAKYAVLLGKNINNGFEYALRYKRLANGTIEFRIRGKNVSFRDIVGVTDPLDEAHHIIPQGKSGHSFVQRAANAKNDHWHLHMPDNGMAAKKFNFDYPDGVHANHPNYNNQVSNIMDQFEQRLVNATGVNNIQDVSADIASSKLQELQGWLRGQIEANPTTKINELELENIIDYNDFF